ncbi:ribonuclease T [uncultured Sphingomonas sp.]|uniref:ribonuclease T2 family protein n=1 Tax=uncultured Sphingomonas sp. TaxID=158754 RepID=UPI0025D03129|nr:ribonuclease T [uncultured Sphingomonas sp.]
MMAPFLALAAALSCQPPAGLPTPRLEGPTADQPARKLPIGSYTLSLIWTPEQCRPEADNGEHVDCAIARGFVLHGLWPDGKGAQWPQYCRSAAILPQSTLRAHYCATPSAQLLQHEWAKHGTCMAGYTPDRYFGQAGRLYRRLRAPAMATLAGTPDLTVRQFSGAYERTNRLPTGSVRLNVNRRGWLQEVWLCLDRRFRPQRCPVHQGGAAPDMRLKIQTAG